MYCSCLVSRAIEPWLKKNSVGLEGTLMNERVCPLYPFFIWPLQLSLIFMCWCTPHTLRFHPDCHPYPWRKSFRGLQCVQRLIYFHPECKVSCQGEWNLHRIWWREKYLRLTCEPTVWKLVRVRRFSCVKINVLCCENAWAKQENWRFAQSSFSRVKSQLCVKQSKSKRVYKSTSPVAFADVNNQRKWKQQQQNPCLNLSRHQLQHVCTH